MASHGSEADESRDCDKLADRDGMCLRPLVTFGTLLNAHSDFASRGAEIMATISRSPARPGVSRPARTGDSASIREVCLIGAGAGPALEPDEALWWAGRRYRVVAAEGGATMHVRAVDSGRA